MIVHKYVAIYVQMYAHSLFIYKHTKRNKISNANAFFELSFPFLFHLFLGGYFGCGYGGKKLSQSSNLGAKLRITSLTGTWLAFFLSMAAGAVPVVII